MQKEVPTKEKIIEEVDSLSTRSLAASPALQRWSGAQTPPVALGRTQASPGLRREVAVRVVDVGGGER